MSDLEAGGALVTAGLVARELEKKAGAGSKKESHRGMCGNCGAALLGRYCHACGQAAHVHRSLWHIAEEAVHGILHFDTKSWRTLPLLIARPGLLTRRYIDGQRVRYVSPLAAFLFTLFVMFFVFSRINTDSDFNFGTAKDREEIRQELTAAVNEARGKIPEQEVALKAASNEEERKEAAGELADLQATASIAEQALAGFDAAAKAAGKSLPAADNAATTPRSSVNV